MMLESDGYASRPDGGVKRKRPGSVFLGRGCIRFIVLLIVLVLALSWVGATIGPMIASYLPTWSSMMEGRK